MGNNKYNGLFGKLNEAPRLEIGTIVWGVAPDGETKWAVYDNENKLVKLSKGIDGEYFSHPFRALDKYAKPYDKRFGIGFYYDLNEQKATEEEINEAIERANYFIEECSNNEEKRRKQWDSSILRIEADFGGIYERKPNKYGIASHVAKNVRKALKMAFPNFKFSVKKYLSDDILIQWTNGPAKSEVEKVVSIFKKNYHRDRWNDDIWNSDDTPFTSAFGGVDMIRLERDFSSELIEPIVVEIISECQKLEHEMLKRDALLMKNFEKVRCKYGFGFENANYCSALSIATNYLEGFSFMNEEKK